MSWKTRLIVLVCLLVFAQAAVAQQRPGIVGQLETMCQTIKQIVPMVALLMFIIAGAVYAAGQVMGAETRARANVWSTAMLVGGIIGLIIAASAPYFVQVFSQFSLGTTATSFSSVSC
ncbi:MAG: hypothetical protein QXG98_05015 [Candidatus Micrarchaeia archaeon]